MLEVKDIKKKISEVAWKKFGGIEAIDMLKEFEFPPIKGEISNDGRTASLWLEYKSCIVDVLVKGNHTSIEIYRKSN